MLFDALDKYVSELGTVVEALHPDRKALLDHFAGMIALAHKKGDVRLVFICTHNSRRSHLAQVWATSMAKFFGLDGIYSWSGGTEATAFHPNAIEALRRAGFSIADAEGKNPVYEVRYSEYAPPIGCFSKVYDHPDNPSRDFGAVMTCSDADENCPIVSGASWRLSLTYDDPKVSDGTPEEAAVYDARVKEIGAELWYVMGKVRQMITTI